MSEYVWLIRMSIQDDRRDNEDFDIFPYLKSFNKELKRLDQFIVLFSAMILTPYGSYYTSKK